MGDRVLFLTGAASGIGRHLVGAFVRAGDRVYATDLDQAALARAAREDRWPEALVRCGVLDVRDGEAWERTVEAAVTTYGRLDVGLNVAGALRPGKVWETTTKDVDLHIDVNVKGVLHGTRVLARHFVGKRSGHVVNFGSLASLAPVPGLALYSASKFAVRGFSLAAAQELLPHGVAVTVVMPDAVRTPMLDLQVDYPEAAMTFSGSRPLTVEEIAKVVLEDVLPRRPLEVAIPLSRGLVARAADVAPDLVRRFGPLLAARGRKAQQREKRGRS